MNHLLYIQISFKSLCVLIPTPWLVSFKYSLKVFFSQGVLLNLSNLQKKKRFFQEMLQGKNHFYLLNNLINFYKEMFHQLNQWF